MFSSSHSTCKNELFELVFVKEEKDCSVSFLNNSKVDEHIEHVYVKDEHDKHQLPSHKLFKLEDDLACGMVKKEDHRGEEISISSQQLHRNDSPKNEDHVKALGRAATGSSWSVSTLAGELSACPSVLGGDAGTLAIVRGNVKDISTSSELDQKEKSLACGTCGYNTNRSDRLQKHFLIHKDVRDKPFFCHLCKYRTDQKSKLKRHLCMHESVRDKPFSCHYCEYRADQKSRLDRHLRTHESARDKPFACHYCEYKTDHKGSLIIHFRVHESVRDKSFACSCCQYRTDVKSNLTRHLRTHGSVRVKLFACHHCNYQTDMKGHLNRHMPTHERIATP